VNLPLLKESSQLFGEARFKAWVKLRKGGLVADALLVGLGRGALLGKRSIERGIPIPDVRAVYDVNLRFVKLMNGIVAPEEEEVFSFVSSVTLRMFRCFRVTRSA
jgi:hypothetical protein